MERIKQDPERRQKFMSYEMNLMDARAEGRAEGRKKTIKVTAQLLSEYEPGREKLIHKLMNKFNLSYDKAKQYIE